MLTILIRTIIIYVILILVMRLMGKRQIGELEISELVGTLILSEIASIPIENQEIPISYAIIPIITITFIETINSYLLVKFPNLKSFLSARPSTLIENGVINQKEMLNSRISTEELIGELRQSAITDISEVNYAILEQNGKISVIPKAEFKQPTMSDLSLKSEENGIMHILISNGYVNKYNIKEQNKTQKWLDNILTRYNCTISDVFLLLVDDSGKTILVKKESNK